MKNKEVLRVKAPLLCPLNNTKLNQDQEVRVWLNHLILRHPI